MKLILSYFIVTGTALVGLLFLVSSGLDPNSSPIKTSQTMGIPQTFKAPPKQSRYKTDGVTFAAEQARSAANRTFSY